MSGNPDCSFEWALKHLCVYLCNVASSSRIPSSLKTVIFFCVLAYRPRVPAENGPRKCIFKKLSIVAWKRSGVGTQAVSRAEIFENSALSFSCERTETEVFEYGDLINHTAPIRIRYVWTRVSFFENREKISVFNNTCGRGFRYWCFKWYMRL